MRDLCPEQSAILERLEPLRSALLAHPVYPKITSLPALRIFMEHHIYAVWDFMSLLKSLQMIFTTCRVPWVPVGDREVRRLINEIVLGEESDEDGRGGHASHFELYLHAMHEVGADTRRVLALTEGLQNGAEWSQAARHAELPQAALDFMAATFSIIEGGDLPAIAAAFTLGREDLIPDMFRKIVDDLAAEEPARLAVFRFYLERHIGLDEEEHGPMAMELLRRVCDGKAGAWERAERAAQKSLQARLQLWSAIDRALSTLQR